MCNYRPHTFLLILSSSAGREPAAVTGSGDLSCMEAHTHIKRLSVLSGTDFVCVFLFTWFFLYKGLYVWKFRLCCHALLVSNGKWCFFVCVLGNGVLVWVLVGGGSLLCKGNGAWNAQNACGLNGRSTPPATGHASSLVCPIGESSGLLLSALWRRVEGHNLTKSSAFPSVSAGDQKWPSPSSHTGPDLQRLAFSSYIPHTSSFLWAWLETEGPPNWPQAAAFLIRSPL